MYYRDVSLTNVIVIIISTVFSFAITLYASDRFQFSNNKYIKYLQKFILMNIILALFSSFLYIFDFQFLNTIFNDPTDGSSTSTNEGTNNNDINKNDQFKASKNDVVGVRTNTNKEGTEFYNFNIKEEFISGRLYFKSSEVEVQSKIISTLDTNNLNLRDSFIHSPLEGDQLHYLISVLSNSLYLHLIMGYLLFILLIIISCKFLFKDNIEFKKIKKYPLGT